jgi:hypothetical protein
MYPGILTHTKSDIDISNEYADYTPEFIVDGLIRKEGKNIIAAERGTGKTRFLLMIAYAIVFGHDEVLGYKIRSHGDVLLINFEIPEKDYKAFTDPIRRHFESLPNATRNHQLYVTNFKEGQCRTEDIRLAVEKYNPILTIIDSYKIYQAIICNENGNTEINNSNFDLVLGPLDYLIREFKTSIAIINHTNKGTSKLSTNSDLMYGPGALPDFVDQVTLLRKTQEPNQRLIVPEKSRYCGEGLITTNLAEIKSSDPASPYPDTLHYELLESDVNESDHLPVQNSKRIDDSTKKEIIEYIVNKRGTMEEAAKKFLGDERKKGTISKILAKHNQSNR